MPYLSPPTLTRAEQAAILRASSGHPRDHLIISVALGTGLRLAVIVGLNVGDVFTADGRPRGRLRLRGEIAKGGRAGDVFLPDALIPKLRRFWGYKRTAGEGLEPDSPLFCNQAGDRISKRRVQLAFKRWQRAAGFDRLYPFHALRHTAVTNVYRASRNLFLAHRFARHVSPLTTVVYTTRGTRSCSRGSGGWGANPSKVLGTTGKSPRRLGEDRHTILPYLLGSEVVIELLTITLGRNRRN
jgi:integrase/recombinase XerC